MSGFLDIDVDYSDTDSDAEDERNEMIEREKMGQKLFAAIRAHDVFGSKTILDTDSKVVRILDTTNWTPLHVCARKGHTDIGKLLISAGADVEAADAKSWSPLVHATITGHHDFVELLCSKGADVSRRDVNGSSSLHFAALQNQCSIIKLLIASGCDMNALDNRGLNPITVAAAKGSVQAVQLLLRYGCEVVEKFRTVSRVAKTLEKAKTMNMTDSIVSKARRKNDGLRKMKGGIGSMVDHLMKRNRKSRGGVLAS